MKLFKAITNNKITSNCKGLEVYVKENVVVDCLYHSKSFEDGKDIYIVKHNSSKFASKIDNLTLVPMELIVAVNKLNYIGNNGELMWKCSEDLAYFKEITMGATLICGSVTWEDCLKSKPLDGRKMIIVGSKYNSLDNAIKLANSYGNNIIVIGGASIYKQLLPYCQKVYLSIIDNEDIGDAKFDIPKWYSGEVVIKEFKIKKANRN